MIGESKSMNLHQVFEWDSDRGALFGGSYFYFCNNHNNFKFYLGLNLVHGITQDYSLVAILIKSLLNDGLAW